MKHLINICLLLLTNLAAAQNFKQKLLVAEFRIDSPRAGNFTYLVAYNFEKGLLTSKDTILGAETFKKDLKGHYQRYVRFEFGKNFIYHSRYVVSGTGNVIDIKDKKLVTEEADDFISASGDTMIFHRNNVYTGTGYYLLNLKTAEYRRIDDKKHDQDRANRTSPDQLRFLSIDRSSIPYKIVLHDTLGSKTILVKDAGQGPNTPSPDIKTHWLNNTSFLYTVHTINKIDSPKLNELSEKADFPFRVPYLLTLQVHHYNIESNIDSITQMFDSLTNGETNDRFFKDGKGQLIYRTTDIRYFVVDTVHATLSPYLLYEAGNNFSFDILANTNGNNIYYKGKKIGVNHPYKRVVGTGAIALETANNIIHVWSEHTQQWSKLNIPWISSLVGWIDDPN